MKNLPGIDSEYCQGNPTVSSYSCPFEISFYQTRETLNNPETYNSFLTSAITTFRRSRVYKNYKGFLMGLGLNRCQVHGNINEEMATIEMHHHILTIRDIALILCEHTLSTKGYISTFDLVYLLREVHTKHEVCLVMLSLTPHQVYHNEDLLNIHPNQCVGKWIDFLYNYKEGISMDIATKLYYTISEFIREGESTDNNLLELREQILRWSND